MAAILCHGPKGGTGNTTLAAHLATMLGEQGADVTLLTVAALDSLPLHFALPPSTRLPGLTAPSEQAVVAGGISLRHHPRAGQDADFVPMLRDGGFLGASSSRLLVLDMPAGDLALARALLPHVQVHLCTLNASPECLALLPSYLDAGEGCWSDHSLVAINKLDETRKLSRHANAFLRELLGQRLIGRVRRDEAVSEALAMVQPLARYAPASAALADLAAVSTRVADNLGTSIETGQTSATWSWVA